MAPAAAPHAEAVAAAGRDGAGGETAASSDISPLLSQSEAAPTGSRAHRISGSSSSRDPESRSASGSSRGGDGAASLQGRNDEQPDDDGTANPVFRMDDVMRNPLHCEAQAPAGSGGSLQVIVDK